MEYSPDFFEAARAKAGRRLSGLDLAVGLRKAVGREVPAIILTGEISAENRRLMAAQHVPLLTKPVRRNDLILAIDGLWFAEPRLRLVAKGPCQTVHAWPMGWHCQLNAPGLPSRQYCVA
jgi:hypothetical protein